MSPAPTIATEIGRRLLSGGEGGHATTAAIEAIAGEACIDDVTVSLRCPEGQMPALSFLAINQVHLFIFTIALVHVTCGFLVYLASWARLRFQWKRWSSDTDPHSLAVREKLEIYYASLQTAPSAPTTGPSTPNASGLSKATAKTTSFKNLANTVIGENKTSRSSTVDSEGSRNEIATDIEKQETLSNSDIEKQPTGTRLSFREVAQKLKITLRPRLDNWSSFGREVAVEQNFRKRIFEYLKCLILGLNPAGVISHDKYAIMKASYVYTHKLGPNFGFLEHVQRNLEDDISHIVGLSIEFWAIIIIFVLVSGPYGYAFMPFMCAIGGILFLTNGKIVSIARAVTQHGGAGRLSSKIFWFNRPQLLLIPIKLGLFFCAFVYASFIFFVWQFGKNSCPFTDSFYPGWALPWWTIILFNTFIFLHMGTGTMPAYSLVVLMGSDIKAHMLPRRFTKKLLAVAASAKEKVKANKAAAAAAANSKPKETKFLAFSAAKTLEIQDFPGDGAGGGAAKVAGIDASFTEGQLGGTEAAGGSQASTPAVEGTAVGTAHNSAGKDSESSELLPNNLVRGESESSLPNSEASGAQIGKRAALKQAAGRTGRKLFDAIGTNLIGDHSHHDDDDD